jgi:hypothetical protein
MNLESMSLAIPRILQDRITAELATLPAIHGKVVLTFSFNCTMNKVIGSMKVKREIEDEVRP